ncbi:MAG TPA: hypothetical protein VKU77_31985 [Streptosporangiaceae bacterium]|nr:hypothetical protein [Streptosporangiaceae bacterium]
MKEEGQHGHLESDVLAEYQAGLVTGRRRASIASHLAACAQCAGLSGQLAEVSVLLAAAPVPAMPADVARRLDTVLAAEAAQRHSAERAVDDSPPHRASNPRSRGPRRRWDLRLVTQRILLPAAAVLVLAAGGFGLSRVTGSSSSSSAAEGSVAAPASTFAGPAAGAAVPSSQTHAVPAIEAPRNFPVVNSTTDYQRATLRQQLETELRRHTGRALGPQALAPGSLRGCVQRVTAGTVPGTLVLVERAHFQGQPAIVIVAVQGDHDAAWVVASGCSASSAHILATATLPGTSAP